MDVISVKIDEVKLNPNNPRVIKDDKFKKLVQSILSFPEMLEIRPIVVNDEMIVLGGNMRLKACEAAGLKTVPIIKASDLTPDQQREFIIKDNVGFGEWDYEMLANEWEEDQLVEWGLDIPIIDDEQATPEDDGFQVPEDVQTDIVPGDLFEIGGHRILCGDSCNIDDVDRLMGGEKADLVFTDPPYDLEDDYSSNLFIISKEDCHVFIMNSDRKIIEISAKNIDYFKKIYAVDFRQARLVSNNQPMTRVDLIAEFNKGKGRFINTNDGFSTLIECSKIHSDKVELNHGHKQAKRVELPGKFIEHYSIKGDIVVDLFLGAGSTLIASEQMDRTCYGMEKDPKNVQIIINRLTEHMKNDGKKVAIKLNGEKYVPVI
jgi:DNA modification methylase